jgi:hypothetical protein
VDHSVDLDGLVYIGRRCGKPCLAMFGDSDSPRRYQSDIRTLAAQHREIMDAKNLI